jgi:hypothetical protein
MRPQDAEGRRLLSNFGSTLAPDCERRRAKGSEMHAQSRSDDDNGPAAKGVRNAG